MELWLKGLGVAFVGGVVAVVPEALKGGLEFSVDGLLKIGVNILAGGLTAVVLYLKQSPLKKRE